MSTSFRICSHPYMMLKKHTDRNRRRNAETGMEEGIEIGIDRGIETGINTGIETGLGIGAENRMVTATGPAPLFLI
ncbi:hypothetical protein D3C78_768950 [compost metagenome]